MDRVTTFSSYSAVTSALMQAENSEAVAQTQISTGKLATDLKGYGANAEALTATKTLKARTDSFIDNNNAAASKLSAQDLALGQVSDAATGARQAIANAVASGRADGLMESLQSYFTQAASGLNSQYNGHYLFAGGKVDTAPVGAQTLSDLTTMAPTQIFQNDQLAETTRLDQSTTLQTGMLADGVGTGLFNAFAAVQTYQQGAGGPFSGTLTAAQTTFLTGMLQTFDTASTGVTAAAASNGLNQNRVDDALTSNKDRQSMLEGMVGDMTNVDIAKSSSLLSQSQLALQASAQVFSGLQTYSLLNFLK